MFNYAELIIAISQNTAGLESAQRTNNTALMISIASQLTRLSAVLAHELGKEVS